MRLWKLMSREGLLIEPAVQSNIEDVLQVGFIEIPFPQLTNLGTQTRLPLVTCGIRTAEPMCLVLNWSIARGATLKVLDMVITMNHFTDR
jgi:hypothetical protein